MNVKVANLKFISENKFWQRDAEKLRGYFANFHKEEALFHNHHENGESIYRMPLIQYKVIKNNFVVVGFNEGADLVEKEFLKHKEIKIGDKILKNFETKLDIKDNIMSVENDLYIYKFISPWLPINKKNKKKYIDGELDLNKVLTNNLLSNFKGLGIKIEKRILVTGKFTEKKIDIKNKKMIGFSGKFVTNVKMPDLISIGKRRAVGFGVVQGVR